MANDVGGEQNPGGGQPQGAGGEGRDDGLGAVCGNGEHTHNPHCEVVSEPTPVVTPTVPTGAAAEPTAEVVGIQDAQGGAPEQAVAGQAAVAVTEIISMPPVLTHAPASALQEGHHPSGQRPEGKMWF